MYTCMSVSLVMFEQMNDPTEIIRGLRKKYVWSVVDQYNRSFEIRIQAYFKIRLRSIRLYNEDISIFRSSSQDVTTPKNLSESCYDLMKINDSITVNFKRYCHSKNLRDENKNMVDFFTHAEYDMQGSPNTPHWLGFKAGRQPSLASQRVSKCLCSAFLNI